jgi:hypothetical protein
MARANLKLSVVVLASVALALAGCGGSSDPGVAKLATSAASTTTTAAGGETPGGGGGSASSSGGGGEQRSEAAIAGPGGPEAQKKMVAFAQCIRSHGVPDFPEPSEGRLIVKGTSKNGLNPGSPQFQAAMKACRSLAPAPKLSPQQTAAMQAQALKFSECMRSHGVPNFPDPKFEGGGVRLSLNGSSGSASSGSSINPRSPQFQAAQKACQGDLPGPKGGPGGAVRVGPAGP